jgi:outer membrane protein TolC
LLHPLVAHVGADGDRSTVTHALLVPLLLTLTGTPGVSPDPEPLTLAQALEELDRQGLTLAQARSRAEEAAGVVRQSAAALLPTLSAGVTLLRNSDEAALTLPLQLGGRSVVIQPDASTTWTAAVRIPLVAPSAWYDLAAARAAARAAGRSSEAVRLTARAGLAQTAHAAAAAEELTAAAARAVANADELVKSAGRRVQAGTAAPLEVTRARAELVRRQSDLAGAHAAVDRGRLAAGVMLGRRTSVRILVPDVEEAPAPELGADAAALVDEGLAHRPELEAHAAQRAAAEAGVRGAWARLAPQLSASASAFASDVPSPTGEKDGWRATLDLTWQLYDGGWRYGRLRQARAQAEGARAALEAQRLAVAREVLDARRDLEVARERLRLARAQAELAADSAASIRRSFEAGVASSLDVLDANDRLFVADSGRAEARARLAQARIALQLALGRER